MKLVSGKLENAVSITAMMGRKLNALCFTCNGSVRRRQGITSDAVLGVGTGKWAARTFSGLAKALGSLITTNSKQQRVFVLNNKAVEFALVGLKTKDAWPLDSNFTIIENLLKQLTATATLKGWETVVLPIVGSGSGKLPKADVLQLMHEHLDDRFIVVEPGIEETVWEAQF